MLRLVLVFDSIESVLFDNVLEEKRFLIYFEDVLSFRVFLVINVCLS